MISWYFVAISDLRRGPHVASHYVNPDVKGGYVDPEVPPSHTNT